MSTTSKHPELLAYAVEEREGKSYYSKIGEAWPTQNGGYSIRLNALPVDGKLVLFPPKAHGESEVEAQS